jgi:hypothetical protein
MCLYQLLSVGCVRLGTSATRGRRTFMLTDTSVKTLPSSQVLWNFLQKIRGILRAEEFYSGDDMNHREEPNNQQKPDAVWIMHDESRQRRCRARLVGRKAPGPCKKRSRPFNHDIMSDFLYPCHGRLSTVIDGVKEYTTEVLEIGKDNEGFWMSLHAIAQVKNQSSIGCGCFAPKGDCSLYI